MDTSDKTETAAFLLKLKVLDKDEYRRRHDEIWPDMRDALRAAGVLDYEIWWEPGSDRLFAWMRRRRDHTLASLPGQDVWRRWQAHMADLLVQEDGAPVTLGLEHMFRLK